MGTVISNPKLVINGTSYSSGSTGLTRANLSIDMDYTDTWSGYRYVKVNTNGYLFRNGTRVAMFYSDEYHGEDVYPAQFRHSAHNSQGPFDLSSYAPFDTVKIVQTNTDSNGNYNDDGEWYYYFAFGTPNAPGNIRLSGTSVKPSTNVTLSWDAPSVNNNTISQYEVYRNGSLLGTVNGTSMTVTANATQGGTFTYKVRAIASYGDKVSDFSSEVILTSYTYGTPTAPGNVSLSSSYLKPGNTATLSWGASTVTNDTIKQYDVYKNGNFLGSTNANTRQYTVTANSTSGRYDTYTIKAVGNDGGKVSNASSGVTLYSYSDPQAPTTVTPSKSSPQSGESISISFSGASGGYYNGITGYTLLECATIDGTYTEKASITTTSTQGSFTITADQSGVKYYAVRANGQRSNSALSTPVRVGINNPPNVPAIKIGGTGQEITTTGTAVSSTIEKPMLLIRCSDVDQGQTVSLQQKIDNGDWETISSGQNQFYTTVRLGNSGTYLFRAIDDAGDTSESSGVVYTKQNYAYTDYPVVARTTRIKAAHLNEIRQMLETMAAYYGATAPVWTEQIIAGTTSIRNTNSHISEVRIYIAELCEDMIENGLTPIVPTFTADISSRQVKADAINELIRAIASL